MASGDGSSGFFSKLRDLTVKIDKTLMKQDFSQLKENESSVTDGLKRIKHQVAKITEDAETQLAEFQEYNEKMEKNLEISNIRISAIENDIASITECLKDKGIIIEKFEKFENNNNIGVERESPKHTPKQEIRVSPIIERKSKTPDIGSFGLSSPTVRFMYSNSTEVIKTQKSHFTAVYGETHPKFHLESEIINKTETDGPQTPETPELTVFIPTKPAETAAANSFLRPNIDVTTEITSALDYEDNAILEDPELTLHHKSPNIHDRDEDDLPPTPKFSLKYNFM